MATRVPRDRASHVLAIDVIDDMLRAEDAAKDFSLL
jgi:hypothetical protein